MHDVNHKPTTPRQLLAHLQQQELAGVVVVGLEVGGRLQISFANVPLEQLCFVHRMLGRAIDQQLDAQLGAMKRQGD